MGVPGADTFPAWKFQFGNLTIKHHCREINYPIFVAIIIKKRICSDVQEFRIQLWTDDHGCAFFSLQYRSDLNNNVNFFPGPSIKMRWVAKPMKLYFECTCSCHTAKGAVNDLELQWKLWKNWSPCKDIAFWSVTSSRNADWLELKSSSNWRYLFSYEIKNIFLLLTFLESTCS